MTAGNALGIFDQKRRSQYRWSNEFDPTGEGFAGARGLKEVPFRPDPFYSLAAINGHIARWYNGRNCMFVNDLGSHIF